MALHKKCATTHIETEAALQLPSAKVNTFADIHKKMNIKKRLAQDATNLISDFVKYRNLKK